MPANAGIQILAKALVPRFRGDERDSAVSKRNTMPLNITPEEWTQVRYEYEHTDKPVDEIGLDHGVSPSTLRDRVRRWRWTRRRQPISAEGPPPMPIEYAAPLVPSVAPLGAAAP